MYPSDTSSAPSKRARTPEPQGRVLRPRKRARSDYFEGVERNVPSRSSQRRRKVPARFRKVPGVFAFLAKMLTDVPIEVVYLIFSYLDPRDLLVLSRTCKLLRGILFNKDTTVELVWRTARLNIEGNLPPLPMDLNEPQYAHLMFDTDCNICDKSSSSNIVLWRFRLRCCRDCLTTFRVFNWRTFHDELYPFTSFEIILKESVQVPGKDYSTFIVDFQKASDLKSEFLSLESEEHRQSWLVQKRQEQTAIVQHASLCQAWHKDQLERRSAQLITLRTKRLEAILTRLDVVGLRREAEIIIDGRSNLNDPKDFKDLSCVKQSKALTDLGWAHIKSKLIKMLSEHRTRRLAQQNYSRLREVYAKYLSHRDLRGLYPGLGDVFNDPVVEASIWDTELEEGLTSLSLQTLLVQFLERFLDDWRRSRTEELLVILRKSRPTAILKDLCLATTVFGCTKCNSLLICPQVFYHRCCYTNRMANSRSHDRMRILNARYDTEEGPWSSSSLFFHSESLQFAQKIVISAGLDPAIATFSNLTIAQPVIECISSQADFFPERLFVTWAAALTYNLTVKDETRFVINRIDNETPGIRAREPLSMFLKTVCCARCHAEVTPKSFIRHLDNAHNLDYHPGTDSASRAFYLLHGSHWYWNPRANLDLIGMDFRW
ncbi:hypothetical protein EV360DRAFT_84630 [Lentinula raphanica]|nr:hypothetical protein EV360DRAFT_84630 [Lentinula raphanica]